MSAPARGGTDPGLPVRELRDAACEYADRGWHVHPLVPRAKRPLTPHGKDDAVSDLVTVLNWWRQWPEANIGIHCHASGLVVIDIDPRHGGDETIIDLERDWGDMPPGPSAETGGGGFHYLFRHPGVPLVGRLGPGVDIKDHGYILAAPSVHPSGRAYEWDNHPDDAELTDLPVVWLERMKVPERVAPSELRLDHGDDLRTVPAATYIRELTGRDANRAGFVRCPFHGGGDERTPSLKVTDTLWACHACQPLLGKRVLGGNIYDFAALLWDVPIPPRGVDFIQLADRLRKLFS